MEFIPAYNIPAYNISIHEKQPVYLNKRDIHSFSPFQKDGENCLLFHVNPLKISGIFVLCQKDNPVVYNKLMKSLAF